MQEKTARVTAVHKERYELSCDSERIYGKLKTSVYRNNNTQPYPTTGDWVTVQYNPKGDSIIVQTLPRKSFFSRLDPDKTRPREQAVAANFDYVFIVTSLNQDFNLRRVERYLSLAWQSGAGPVIILTKADLTGTAAQKEADAAAIAAGVPVHAVSVVTGFGLSALTQYLVAGKTIVFLGSSGAGKSSLLNALANEDIMQVNTIREDDGKGRHTTTHRQLITLPSGASIIDTPGMRELGMWDADQGIRGAFADVEALSGRCRFADCRHQTEPGCAVLAALQDGTLKQERWEHYHKLIREALFTDNKAAAIRAKQERGKSIARWNKQNQKNEKNKWNGR